MKVTRSYLLGLGSGLILSAMLTMVISPQKGRAVVSPELSSTPPITQESTLPAEESKVTKPTNPSDASHASETTQPSPVAPTNTPDTPKLEQNFVIPVGTSAKGIANLLADQGYISDKAGFLEVAHQLGVENRFRAGTFSLTKGLTAEELLHRLFK